MKYFKSFFRVLSLLLLIVVFSCNIEPFGGEVPEKEIETELSCVDAQQNTITATTNFSTAVSTDSNYTELCSAYKKALEDQISACGDEGGVMQSLVDGLDCSSDEELNDCDEAIQTSSEAQTALANSGNENYASLCAAYKVALQNQINVCGDTDGNLQTIVDGLGSCEESLITNCDDAIAATAIAQGLLSSATNENYTTLCNAYKIALSSQINLCGDTDGSLQNTVDDLGNCEQDVSEVAEKRALMTANINGVEYNDLKPNTYLLFQEAIGFNGFFSRSDDNYIELQGNSTYTTPTVIEANTKEINIHIPTPFWKEGTFVMHHIDEDYLTPQIFYSFLVFDNPDNIDSNEFTGEIIISKFSLTEKIIKGTFEFEYKLINTDDNSEEGPLKVTGTFDYSLDDEFFD